VDAYVPHLSWYWSINVFGSAHCPALTNCDCPGFCWYIQVRRSRRKCWHHTCNIVLFCFCFFFSSRRRHTRLQGDWSSDVCSSDLNLAKYSYDASNGYLKLPEVDWPSSVGTSGQVFSNLPIQTYYPLVNAADDVSWQLSKHLLNFGFSYYREQDHYNNAPAGFPFDA